MAVDVAQFLWVKFLTSGEEILPKLPNGLSEEFQNIKICIGEQDESKTLWSSPAAGAAFLPYLYDLNDALADCRIFVEHPQELTQNFSLLNPFPQKYFLRKIKQRLESISKGLAHLVAQYKDSSSSGMTLFPSSRHTLFESSAVQVVESSEEEKQIKTLLADKGYRAIGVCGVTGSGKTELIQKTLNSPTLFRAFSPVIWVYLSDMESDPEENEDIDVKIVNFILSQLGSEVDKWTIVNTSISVLLEKLKKLLMSKKYLIVFDDVMQKIDFFSDLGGTSPRAESDAVGNRLSNALPRDGGGKIIITSKLKEVVQNMVGKENLIHLKPWPEPGMGFVQSNVSQIIGFDEQAEEIVALLSDYGYGAIGVCGMSGSGKTALIHKVLSSPRVYNEFSPVIWVCLSDISSEDDEDIGVKIVRYMLCQLRNDADRWINLDPGKAELLGILKSSLESSKYLIVLDDAWETNYFYADLGDRYTLREAGDQLLDALPKDSGGKIIVTSRLREVAENMVGPENLIHMKDLNRESCRLILEAGTGFLQYATQIESMLDESESVKIGLYGPSNSANTALIQRVLSSASFREQFEPIVWVSESHISPREEVGIRSMILKYMLKELGYEADELAGDQSDVELLEIVNRSLFSKRFLIVMADLGNKNNWDGNSGYGRHWIWVSNALCQNGKGTIIVTSGKKDVAQGMVGESSLIHVKLPELGTSETKEVTKIHGRYLTNEIVDMCHGLPLAAMILANIIRKRGQS